MWVCRKLQVGKFVEKKLWKIEYYLHEFPRLTKENKKRCVEVPAHRCKLFALRQNRCQRVDHREFDWKERADSQHILQVFCKWICNWFAYYMFAHCYHRIKMLRTMERGECNTRSVIIYFVAIYRVTNRRFPNQKSSAYDFPQREEAAKGNPCAARKVPLIDRWYNLWQPDQRFVTEHKRPNVKKTINSLCMHNWLRQSRRWKM